MSSFDVSQVVDVSALLRRIGLAEAEPPSAAALARLHRAFVEHVPYEAVEIQLGRPTSLDPLESAERVLRGRGGYCFHLNGTLATLLTALGYRVTMHAGGVQMKPGDDVAIDHHHLVLLVHDLPDSDDVWMADAGLGDGLHSPLPLREGEHRQGPFTFRLCPSEVAPGGWRFGHDPRGSLHSMHFQVEEAALPDFRAAHVHLSTSPNSGFVRTFVAQRTDASGWDVLRALTLSRVEEATKRTVLETSGQWAQALADVFGVVLTAGELDVLWPKVVAQHEAHLTTARP